MFIIFSGVSASGKNTIMQELQKKDEKIKILEMSSGTTRPPRESDKDNNTYLFMTREEFEKGIKENKFFEQEEVHGYYYGILNSALQKVIDSQEIDFMRDVDVHGREKIQKHFEGKCPTLTIFLDAPNEILAQRLKNRGESDERIKVRMARSELERQYKNDYDLVIENVNIEDTVNKILKAIKEKRKQQN